ncbi:ATP-binding cassette domain-containing protein [Rhodococcus erythropolis]|uniref:ATP-binding cassette domain-containing protein n=1 Tax=Rhodococcus erythropolis TaxID=1833 RepID=UPI0022280737|nr:ATP-binding cassette domain-containing protein [Rhodococcus erythropolis]MCW2295409.1 ABC-type sugar transport system ATPase subunit/ribose/xylose/arabinose/galactoside ABC-type transport system permease subunit [Rhodococcus erythropolis]
MTDTTINLRQHLEPGLGGELVAVNISKIFGPTVALDDVSVHFAPGQVYGLLGENGSGKSTFVKIITGIHKADGGTLTFGDADLTNGSQLGSTNAVRVGCVYQDGSLIDELTVSQNLDLVVRPDERGDFAGAEWQRSLLDAFALSDIDEGCLVADLPSNQARLVEIAGMLARKPDIALFDESTSTLDADGVEKVLGLMKAAADHGACVIFVTHRLKEVLSVADRLVVLRDGKLVSDVSATGVSESELIESMAGREVSEFARRAVDSTIGQAEPILRAVGITADQCGPIDFTVRPGEIVGVGGAAGNGQAAFVRGLVGSGLIGGNVEVRGVSINSSVAAVDADVMFVSSDRRFESLSSQLSIRENFTLGSISGTSAWWRWVPRSAEVVRSRQLAKDFGLVHTSIEQPADSMSGGNQQKLAIGRAIARGPKVLVVEEPTEGVDARSRFEIYRTLVEFAEQGAAVVVASSDASELRHLADRVVVLARGRLIAELTGEDITEHSIVRAFTTAVHEEAAQQSEEPEEVRSQLKPVFPSAGSRRSVRGAAKPWDAAKLGFLALFMVLLGGYATTVNANFISLPNIAAICLFALPVAVVALAQLPVMMTGQIDASLGSMMALTVVVVSFMPAMPVAALLGVAIGIGVVMGLVNALLVVVLRINAVIATIATLGIFYGIALLMRPSPGGVINPDINAVLRLGVLGISGVFLALVVVAVVVDVVVYRNRRGLIARAVGYSFPRSESFGVRPKRVQAGAFVLAGALAGVAGLVLAAQTGVGDPTVGSSYTLLAIAVPVLGGALLTGGHGSALGCILGALFVAETQILVPFINLPNGGFLVCVGLLTILALVVGTKGRVTRIS